MSAILYGNLTVEVVSDLGTRIERATLQQARPDMVRSRPDGAPGDGATAGSVLRGREQQSEDALRAVSAGRPLGFHAACGYGKTTLLQQAIVAAREHGVAADCVYLRADGDRIEDLLQSLVEQLFTADRPVKLTPGQRAQLLGHVSAVVAVDDVTAGPDKVDSLLDILPKCSLLLGSSRPVLGRRGTSQDLPGLPDDAALAVIGENLGRPLTDQELSAARQLTASIDGQPLHLRQAAALVREGGHTFQSLAQQVGSDPDVLDRLSIDALAEPERRVLAVLSLAAGALLPPHVVEVIDHVALLGEWLASLHDRGLVEQQADRFGLPVCKADSCREMLLSNLDLGSAVRNLIGWLTTQEPTAAQSKTAADAVLSILEFAGERGQWATVVQLARAADAVYFLAGRWEAWHHVLAKGLQAAIAEGDKAAEAYFSHQLGSLALCRDQLVDSAQLLRRALNLREELGDTDGARLSRHNLELLELPAPPRRREQRARRRSARILTGIVGLIILIGAVSALAAVRGAGSGSGHPTGHTSQSTKHHSNHNGGQGGGGANQGGGSASAPLSLPPATLAVAQAGTPDSETISATGGTTPYQYAVTSGGLPPGLTLAANGVISGTPTSAGQYGFTVTVTDASPTPQTAEQTYQITVNPAALALSPQTLPDGSWEGSNCPGQPYPPQQLSASGGTPPYQYAVTSGDLPPGLTLASDGIISGTPTMNGSYPVTVTVTDSSASPQTAQQQYMITVDYVGSCIS